MLSRKVFSIVVAMARLRRSERPATGSGNIGRPRSYTTCDRNARRDGTRGGLVDGADE